MYIKLEVHHIRLMLETSTLCELYEYMSMMLIITICIFQTHIVTSIYIRERSVYSRHYIVINLPSYWIQLLFFF